jgi:hypothetical protein
MAGLILSAFHENAMKLRILIVVLPGWLAACAQPQQPPLKTSVCAMSAKPGRTVQLDATVSVDAEGSALIGDAHCPGIHLPLQLSTAASRAGADELLQAAAKRAVGNGQSSFEVGLIGIYTDNTEGPQFVASSVLAAAPAP